MPDQTRDKPWPPAEDLPDDEPAGGSRLDGTSRVGFVLAAVALLAMAGFWIWAFSPWAPSGNPDRLDERAFPTAAEAICAAADDAIDDLPPARTATGPEDRAVVVEEANEIVAGMITDLRAAATVASGGDAELIALWLGDYEQFLADREAHATRLAAGEDVQLVVTAIPGAGPIDVRIDGFARVNDMESCEVPLDV